MQSKNISRLSKESAAPVQEKQGNFILLPTETELLMNEDNPFQSFSWNTNFSDIEREKEYEFKKRVLKKELTSKLEKLESSKTEFEKNVEAIFETFKKEYIIHNYEPMKRAVIRKFDEYLADPKSKLLNANDSLETVVYNLNSENGKIVDWYFQDFTNKEEALKNKLHDEELKINGMMIQINTEINSVLLKSRAEEKKDLSDDLVDRAIAGTVVLFAGCGGLCAPFAIGVTCFAEGAFYSVLGGIFFGGLGAFVGVPVGGLVYAGYKVLQYFKNKEKDLIEIVKKAKSDFEKENTENLTKIIKNIDQAKKKFINSVVNIIDSEIINTKKQIERIY